MSGPSASQSHLRLSNATLLDAGTFTASTANGAVEIKAPQQVVDSLFELCDGTRTRSDLENAMRATRPWSELTSFLDALIAQGVLRTSILDAPMQPIACSTAATQPRPVDVSPLEDQLDPVVVRAGFKLFRATLVGDSGRIIKGFGRAKCIEAAIDIATSEAAERHAYHMPHAKLQMCSGREIGNHIDPSSLVRYAVGQYRRRSLAVHTYHSQKLLQWIQATTIVGGATTWCPAELVYSARALNPGARTALIWQTTSGCASDVDICVAIERAGLEVLERDALARHWLEQRPGAQLDPNSLPLLCQELIDYAKSLQWNVDVGLLQSIGGPVVITSCTAPHHAICALSTACSNSLESALEHSLAESLITGLTRASMHTRVPRIRPTTCRRPIDHGNLYAQRRYFARANAIARGGAPITFSMAQAHWPDSLADRLALAGADDAAWVDMTPPDAPISRHGRRIHTVRALIPGAIPLTFGFDALPRGMGVVGVPSGKFPHPLP